MKMVRRIFLTAVAMTALFAAVAGEAQTVSQKCVDAVHHKYPDASPSWVVTALTRGDTTELRWRSASGLFGTCTLDSHGQIADVSSTGRRTSKPTDRIELDEVVVFETYTVTCVSEEEGRHGCSVKEGAVVELVEVHGESDCVLDLSWGHEDNHIWVDQGCHGTFNVRPAHQPLQPLPTQPDTGTDLRSTVGAPELRTLEGRAQEACLREAINQGIEVTHHYGTRAVGSYIVVFIGVQSWAQKGDVTCRYDPKNDRAVIAR